MTTSDDENNQKGQQSQSSDDSKKQVVIAEMIPKRPEIIPTDRLLNFSLDNEPKKKIPPVKNDNE